MFWNVSAPPFACLKKPIAQNHGLLMHCFVILVIVLPNQQDNWPMKIQSIFSLSLENGYHGRATRLGTRTKPPHLHTVYFVTQSKARNTPSPTLVTCDGWMLGKFRSCHWCLWTGWARLVLWCQCEESETSIRHLCLFTLSSLASITILTLPSAATKLLTLLTQQLRAQASLHNIRKQQQLSLIPANTTVCLNSPSNTHQNNQQVTTVPESCHSATATLCLPASRHSAGDGGVRSSALLLIQLIVLTTKTIGWTLQ